MIGNRILSFHAAFLSVIIAVAALMPSTASAASVSITYGLTPVTINGFQSTSHDFVVNANQFNPALGSLTSIDVDWVIEIEATATQTSGTTVGNGLQSSAGGPVSFNGVSYGGIGFSAFGTSTALDEPFTISASGGTVDTLTSGSFSPAAFQGAIGNGTVPLIFSDVAMTLNGSSFLSNVSSTTSGDVKVTYNYRSSSAPVVPLPAALQASLPLLVALVLFRLKSSLASRASRRLV